MDTGIVHVAEKMKVASDEIQGEYDMDLVRKVINLNRKYKELVNKLLDASDQCKDVIDVVLSSTNTVLDLMQKIVKTNTEELNLLMKITELTKKEWELVRKFIYLCNEDRYFVCKFMDWYLNGEGFGFPCSRSTVREVDCLFPAEAEAGTQHNVSRKEANKTVPCKETKIGNPVLAAAENVGIISGDRNEKGGAQPSGKEDSEDLSTMHDSSSMIKNKINPVSVKSCCVKLEPLSLQTAVRKGKRIVPDSSTQEEVSCYPENMEVNSENLTTMSGHEPRQVPAHLSLKDSTKMTDTHNSSLTVKDGTNSVPEKSCSVKLEIESECVKLSDHGQEYLPPQTKMRKGKIMVTDNTMEREASLSSENVELDCENLNTVSEDKTEKVDLSIKENKKMISKNSSSLSEKECSVQEESENECVRSNNEQKLIPLQSKLRSHKRAVLDNRTEKDILFPVHNMNVNNKARTSQEVRYSDVNSYVTFENKCKGEWSAIAGSSIAEETNVSPSGFAEIIRTTDEVKSTVDVKCNRTKFCTSLKEVGFITHGINMFTIATSMTRFLRVVEKKKASPVLVKKALSFFTQARATYSSLEKYLIELKRNENKKYEQLSAHALKLLQFMLKLQQSISQRHAKGGVNMNLIITDITHVMDTVAEIIMVASEKVDIARVLKGKVTVNLKDLKVLQEDSTKKTVTKGKTLNDTNCGVKKLNKTLLSMKRKRDTRQSSYRNNPKKYKAGTSEDQVFKVLQGNEPVKCTSNMVDIPSDCELLESSTKFHQDSANCESLQCSAKGIQGLTDRKYTICSPNGIQVPVIYEPTEFPADGPRVSLSHESRECSSSGLQVPLRHGYMVCSAVENNSENEIITGDLSSNDTSSVVPMVQIKQEVTDFKQEVTDLETSRSSVVPEDSNICEETFTNWQDVIVKEEVTIKEPPYCEDQNFGKEAEEHSVLSVDCVNSEYQNMRNEEPSTVLVRSEEMSNDTYFSDGYRHLQHTIPEIKSQNLMCSEERSLQTVENMTGRSTECMISIEGTAGETVKQTGNMGLQVTPHLLKQTGVIRRIPRFGAAAQVMNEMDKALGIHLPPFSQEKVGSLKWIQYTIAIDHPYAREEEEPVITECHVCEICRKVIISACNVNRHVNSHFKNSAVTCNNCGEQICSYQLWTKHKQSCFAANSIRNKGNRMISVLSDVS